MSHTILLVDDEHDIRRLMARVLETAGYRVVQARDGSEALALFEPSMDLLVTDMQMPKMDGRTLIAHLTQRHHALKIVVVSGHPVDPPLDPAVACIRKPFTGSMLLGAVRSALS